MRERRDKTIVFAGGGHAHLYSLRRTARLVNAGYQVILVNSSPYLFYSGMATGVISGSYAPNENRVDVRALVERGGGTFVEGHVSRILKDERALSLEDGRRIDYDAASFCLGSETDWDTPREREIPVKPVANTIEIRAVLKSFLPGAQAKRVLVVGGGAAGCEVSANAVSLLQGSGNRITLVEGGPSLLSASPERARRYILEHLQRSGVEVLTNTAVTSRESTSESISERGGVLTADGRSLSADLVIATTGIKPPDVFRRSGLATGGDGGLWVDPHLRSISDERVFGGGDSISFRGDNLPKLGVFAIREGPILFRNLQAALRGEPLEVFEPQRRYLYIIDLGDRTGLAIYGRLVWHGRSAWWLKHAIDKRFMREYKMSVSSSVDQSVSKRLKD